MDDNKEPDRVNNTGPHKKHSKGKKKSAVPKHKVSKGSKGVKHSVAVNNLGPPATQTDPSPPSPVSKDNIPEKSPSDLPHSPLKKTRKSKKMPEKNPNPNPGQPNPGNPKPHPGQPNPNPVHPNPAHPNPAHPNPAHPNPAQPNPNPNPGNPSPHPKANPGHPTPGHPKPHPDPPDPKAHPHKIRKSSHPKDKVDKDAAAEPEEIPPGLMDRKDTIINDVKSVTNVQDPVQPAASPTPSKTGEAEPTAVAESRPPPPAPPPDEHRTSIESAKQHLMQAFKKNWPFKGKKVSEPQDDDQEEEMEVHDEFSGNMKPPDENQDKDEYRNVWSVEAFKPTKDRRYAKKYARAFMPFMFLATLFGRFPLSYSFGEDGTLEYKFSLRSPSELSFIISGIWNTLLFFMVYINLFGVMLDFPRTPHHNGKIGRLIESEELVIIKRNVVPLVIFVTNLTHLFIATVCVFIKRNYIVRYFAYWGEVVELLRLDVADKLRMDMLRKMLILMLMFIVIIGLNASNIFSACNGGAAAISILIGRFFRPGAHALKNFSVFKWFSIVVFAFTYIGAKFYMVYFFYRCRLIKNLLIVWNRRFNICVFGGPGATKKMVRSTRAYLFKDHIVTLNLIEGANYELRWIVESYAFLNMFSMVFEAYHIYRAVTGDEFDKNRQLDFIPMLIFLLFDFYIFFMTYLEGGMIPEQTKVAFDVVKKKGMMLERADQELWFMLSMRISFAGCAGGQPLGIIGAEFFFVSKTFIIIAIGFMTSHFIMLYQFEFKLDQTPFSDPNCVKIDVDYLLKKVERTRDIFGLKHYTSACQNII